MGRNTESGTMSKADVMDLFDKPKTATDLLKDLESYKMNQMSKAEITERWAGHQWSSDEMTAWSRWQWKEVVK
jgi:hypothetical protein